MLGDSLRSLQLLSQTRDLVVVLTGFPCCIFITSLLEREDPLFLSQVLKLSLCLFTLPCQFQHTGTHVFHRFVHQWTIILLLCSHCISLCFYKSSHLVEEGGTLLFSCCNLSLIKSENRVWTTSLGKHVQSIFLVLIDHLKLLNL